MRGIASSVTAARLTWVVLAAIVALLVVAGVDALRSSGSESAATSSGDTGVASTGALELCVPAQLMLQVERLGDGLSLVLDHVEGPPCRTRRLPIRLSLLDRAGLPANARANVQDAFAPATHSPNVDLIAPFAVLYKCGEAKPELYDAEAGSYRGGGRLPRSDAECLNDLGP
jgi:hypothetical protein